MSLLLPVGLAALGLIPMIVLLYILRSSPRSRVVSSVQLWEGVSRQVTAHARWRRPRLEVLLLLQVAFVTLGALALARPALSGSVQRNLTIVLDASASMQALDGDPSGSRFDQGRRLAQDLIAGTRGVNQLTIVRAAAHPEVLYTGGDSATALSQLATVPPGAAHANIAAALSMAASIAAGSDAQTDTVLISDGAYPPIGDANRLGTPVRIMLVGHDTTNQSVSFATARRSTTPSGLLDGFARVSNLADRAVELTVDIAADGAPLESRQVRLGQLSRADLTFSLPPGTRRFSVALRNGDLLPLDDSIESVVETATRHRVVLVSDAPAPLAPALRALPNVDLLIESPASYDAPAADLTVFDRFLPQTLPPAPLIIVHPPAGASIVTLADEKFDLEATTVAGANPLLSGVDTGALRFSGAGIAEAPTWATTVASAGGVPLLLQGQVDGQRVVVLGFDPASSHLADTAALPLLVANAVSWTTAAVAAAPADPVEHDQPIDITPHSHPELSTATQASAPQPAPLELWPLLGLAAALVLGWEWWHYARHG